MNSDANEMASNDVRGFLAMEMRRRFPGPRYRLVMQTSEEFVASGDPRALSLHRSGLIQPYVAFSFEPPGIDVAHVGCILTDVGHMSVGLHVVGAHADRFRAEIERLSAATGLPIVEAEAVGEIQCNEAPIADADDGRQRLAAKAQLFCLWLEHSMGG